MYNQEPKQLIDVGEIGNASTGDILFDGGLKLNSNMNAIYNSFGDQRKMSLDSGQGTTGQVIHATGYYQKSENPAVDFQTPVQNGSMHDIDTSAGPVVVRLDQGVRGEGVFFINSSGSISVQNPLTIEPKDNFVGISGPLVVTSPFSEIKVWCISDDGGRSVWNYSIRNMFGDYYDPVQGTWQIPVAGVVDFPLFHKNEYIASKLLVTSRSNDGKRIKSSEINILIDVVTNTVISTEYAVMRVGALTEEDDIVTYSFSISGTGMITMTANGASGLRVAVKSITTQKIGAAQ
ncbi:baseplate wedge tail fiber connector [Salmonella phage Melville]|uniref:Baseplate wedge tail fiber connector n=1 Tax=Salmonella phage Melville TaxID=2041413 RepID=A0A2D1GMG4_9CAUD|nr:baseplate wedge tail fiber protein connector [Salmonella phage Melville]ATN93121.1 baseplate wedge tail fiber connector [Salmonella phage Melville]